MIAYRCMAGGEIDSPASDPPTALDEQVQHEADEQHERERNGVAEAPVKLRRAIEFHAVDRADQRRREEDGRPGREIID
jgi:hypothetical protein